MADITMSYAALEGAATKVDTAKGNLESVISNLTAAVSALEGNWEGASYRAFVSAWEEAKPMLQKLTAAVGDFSPELKTVVSRQQEMESANAGLFQ